MYFCKFDEGMEPPSLQNYIHFRGKTNFCMCDGPIMGNSKESWGVAGPIWCVFFCPAGWVATNKVGAQGGAPPSIFFLQKSGNDKVRGDIV